MLDGFELLLKNNEIEDVYLIGALDVENNRGEFIPLSSQIYLSCGSRYIKLTQVHSGEHIQISLCDDFDYEGIFEDTIPSSIRVSHLVFTDSFQLHRVKKIIFFNLTTEASFLQCNALQIEFTDGQVLFFDPLHYDGLTVGGMTQREYWENEYNEILAPLRGAVQEYSKEF